MPPKIQLRSALANAELLRGKNLSDDDIAIRLESDADVFKPDGTPLVMLRRKAIPTHISEHAYDALHELRKFRTDNRGSYTGQPRIGIVYADGAVSKNQHTRDPSGKRVSVASAIVGYFDQQGGRIPFCRETRFTANHVEQWYTILPMIEHVARMFESELPTRYKLQKQACDACPQEFVIQGTPFTTLTVNNNVAPAAAHLDKGDFKSGMGIISVVRRGSYTGSLLVFPEFFVGVDLQDGDVLFFNSHEWHGVTPMVKQSEDAERISVVYYMREKMKRCEPSATRIGRLREMEDAKVSGDA